jgi:hypothetical protein
MLNAVAVQWPNTIQLYCFFHLMQLAHVRFQHSPRYWDILCFLRDCHYSNSAEEYDAIWNDFFTENDVEGNAAHPFCDWIQSTLENDGMLRWQQFHTPQGKFFDLLGYSGTNNPLETFNKILKAEVSMWKRLVLTTLIDGLFELISFKISDSTRNDPFSHIPIVSKRLSQRAVRMVNTGRLFTNMVNDFINYLG